MSFQVGQAVKELEGFDLHTEDGIRGYGRMVRDIYRAVASVVESDRSVIQEILSETDPMIPDGKNKLLTIGIKKRTARNVASRLGHVIDLSRVASSHAAGFVASFDRNYLDQSVAASSGGKSKGVKFNNNRRRPTRRSA